MRGIGELVLLALQQVVVPVQHDCILVVLVRIGPKVHCANLAPAAGVSADGDQQPLIGARCLIARVVAHAHVVAQRSALEDVVPGGNGQRGHLNIGEVLLNRPLFPVAVIGGMRQPVDVVRRKLARQRGWSLDGLNVEDRKLGQRQHALAHHCIRGIAHHATRRVLRQA